METLSSHTPTVNFETLIHYGGSFLRYLFTTGMEGSEVRIKSVVDYLYQYLVSCSSEEGKVIYVVCNRKDILSTGFYVLDVFIY